MHSANFTELEAGLLASGVAPRYVRRLVMELEHHVEDLRTEALRHGAAEADATAMAITRLGNHEDIARSMLADSGLRSWIYRYPRVARVYLPVAWCLALPAAPLFAGLANPGKIARWGAALMMSAGVTAAMLLCMQLAIVLT